jgi:SAM-dependent methyltransferase
VTTPIWRTRLSAALTAVASLFERAMRAAVYAAAAALPFETFRDAVSREWDSYRRDDGVGSGGLYAWELDIYERFVSPADRILLVGSGTGRDLIALIGRGHEVVALEPSGAAMALARQHLQRLGLTAVCVEGRMEDAGVPGTFDVIVFSFNCYTFIPGARHRIAALQRARDLLRPGGRIVVTYFEVPAQARQLAVGVGRLVARLTRSGWRLETGDVLRLGPGLSLQYEHTFTASEIVAEADAAGLCVHYHRQRPESAPTVVLRVC